MLRVTTLLDRDNYIEIPAKIHEKWGIVEGQRLYISVNENEIALSKKQGKHSFYASVAIGFGILLPWQLTKRLNMRRNSDIVLTLKNDVVSIGRGKVSYLNFTDKERFEDKIYNEMESTVITEQPWENIRTMEDIGMHLILSTWPPEVVNRLMDERNLLGKLAMSFYEDE